MKLVKQIFALLFAIAIVSMFIASWFPMKYIYENLTYNYFFPILSFHIYTALLYLFIVLAFFYTSPSGIFSKVIGIVLSSYIFYFEFKSYRTSNESTIKYIYLSSMMLGSLTTLILLFKKEKYGK